MRAAVFKGNVIVTNLPVGMTADQLADLFDQYGLVLGAKIERWHDRPGGGQGTIDMAPDTSVDKAIEALNGATIEGSKIAVKRAPKVKAKPKVKIDRAVAPPAPATPLAPVRERPIADRSIIAKHIPKELLAPPPRLNPFGAPVTDPRPPSASTQSSSAGDDATPDFSADRSNPAEMPRPMRMPLGARAGAATTRQVVVEYRTPARRIVIPPRPKKTVSDS